MLLAFFAIGAHRWLIFGLLSATSSRAFSAELLPSSVLFYVTGSCYSFSGRRLAIFLISDPDSQALNQSVMRPTEELSTEMPLSSGGSQLLPQFALPPANSHQELSSPVQCSVLPPPEGEHWRNVLQLKN